MKIAAALALIFIALVAGEGFHSYMTAAVLSLSSVMLLCWPGEKKS